MGGGASCICDPSSRREVLVMKENGEFLRFKEYIRVKDILAANPYQKVIRCCSDRNHVLPDSFQLSCNQLYFLLPRGIFLTDETYENMLRLAAASRNSKLSASIESYSGNPQLPSCESNTKYKAFLCSKDDGDGGDPGNTSSSRWKPTLQTIPEVNSPLPVLAAPQKVN